MYEAEKLYLVNSLAKDSKEERETPPQLYFIRPGTKQTTIFFPIDTFHP